MAEEFVNRDVAGGDDCADRETWGNASDLFTWIFKGNLNQDEYPEEACTPYYHRKAQINALQVNNTLSGNGDSGKGSLVINAATVNATTFSSQSKAFNIPHPTKEGKRLWHGCLEGPEYGVYVRGRLTEKTTIELPDYWDGLVDPETITVHLTQIGSHQDLMVEKIEWGKTVHVKSGTASRIDCYYTVNAMRKDVPVLEVEVDA
tara:strand:+ start:429 stop:1040 length:612 start_codon:yes stop_codon:yes gene_type:complete